MAYPSIYNDWPLSHNDHPIVGLTARVRHNNGDLTINDMGISRTCVLSKLKSVQRIYEDTVPSI
jgi:hypothetical protein